jgi:proteasome accessory factor A
MQNIEALVGFLATRQIYAGSGKATGKPPGQDAPFQISQRADFFNRVFSDRTSETRGIINTRRREIPRLGEDRRLHIICGDSNLSEYAIALKFGVTSMLARLLEDGVLETFPRLLYPVKAMKQVSRDLYALLDLAGKKGKTTALEIQWFYLEKALDYFYSHEISEEERTILELWQNTLEDFEKLEFSPRSGELEYAPERLGRRIDWIAKLWLIDRYRRKGGLAWDDRALIALDFQYHDLDPTSGFFQRCLDMGLIDRWIDDKEVEKAISTPPSGTRAAVRGHVIRETTGRNVEVVVENWEKIAIRARTRDKGPVHPFVRNKRLINALEISMKDPFLVEDAEAIEKLGQFLETWG